MTFSVRMSDEAISDLKSIYSYISSDLMSPEIAMGQLERLEKGIRSLDELPQRYRAYENEPWKSRGLRIMPVDNYLVFYIANTDDKIVTVIRVMYGGRDIEAQLRKYTN